MKQETFDKFDERTFKMTSITISSFVCPHCRDVVRFAVPEGSNLKSLETELQHYKDLVQRLSKDNFDLRMYCRRLAQL